MSENALLPKLILGNKLLSKEKLFLIYVTQSLCTYFLLSTILFHTGKAMESRFSFMLAFVLLPRVKLIIKIFKKIIIHS